MFFIVAGIKNDQLENTYKELLIIKSQSTDLYYFSPENSNTKKQLAGGDLNMWDITLDYELL